MPESELAPVVPWLGSAAVVLVLDFGVAGWVAAVSLEVVRGRVSAVPVVGQTAVAVAEEAAVVGVELAAVFGEELVRCVHGSWQMAVVEVPAEVVMLMEALDWHCDYDCFVVSLRAAWLLRSPVGQQLLLVLAAAVDVAAASAVAAAGFDGEPASWPVGVGHLLAAALPSAAVAARVASAGEG